MEGPAGGKKRSAGLNILLFIVTFGVYWFVWLYFAFTEIAKDQRKDLRAGPWILGLVGLQVTVLALAVFRVADRFRRPVSAGTNPWLDAFDETLSPLALAAAGLSAVYYTVQLLYARIAHTMVAEAASSVGVMPLPSLALAVSFNALLIGGAIPILGGLLALAGLVVAIVWVVQIQAAMNGYWERHGMASTGPPPVPSFAPSPTMAPRNRLP